MSSSSMYFPLIFLAAVLPTTAIVSADHRKHHPGGRLLVEDENDSHKPVTEHKPHQEKPAKGKGEKPPSEENEDKLPKGKEGKPPHENHHGQLLVEEVEEVEEDKLRPKQEDKPPKGKGKKPLHGHLLTEEEEDEDEDEEKSKKTPTEHKLPPHDQQHPGHVHVEEVEDAYISSRKMAQVKPWAP